MPEPGDGSWTSTGNVAADATASGKVAPARRSSTVSR